jgi:hypothetical protein
MRFKEDNAGYFNPHRENVFRFRVRKELSQLVRLGETPRGRTLEGAN